MTGHNDDDRRDDRAYVRQLFSEGAEMPADVVPGTGMTRQDYLDANDVAGTWAEVTVPGEVYSDADGIPNAVAEPRTVAVYRAGTVVTTAELAAVGLTPRDVPNLTLLDPKPKKGHDDDDR